MLSGCAAKMFENILSLIARLPASWRQHEPEIGSDQQPAPVKMRWLPTGRLRSNFVAARLGETENRTQPTKVRECWVL